MKFRGAVLLNQQAATPAAPPAGLVAVYSKADGRLYRLPPDGTERTEGTKLAVKSAQQSNSTVTLADVTDLTFDIGPGTWWFRFVLLWQATATSYGIRISVNGPSSSALRFSREVGTGVASGASTYDAYAQAAAGTANSDLLARIEGAVTTTAAGTLACRFCSSVAGSALLVQPTSWGLLTAL